MDRPPTYVAAVEELGVLVRLPDTPRDAAEGALRFLKRVEKCLYVVPQMSPAAVTGDPDTMLQVSDLFLRYLTAFRARDWPKVSVIEHEAATSPPEIKVPASYPLAWLRPAS